MKTQRILFGIVILMSLILAGCGKKKSLTILSDRLEDSSTPENSVITSLQKSMAAANISLKANVDSAAQEQSILHKINTGEADIAVVKNSIRIDDSYTNIRTVMPLFPEVFLILYKSNEKIADFASLISQGRVALIMNKKEEQLLMYKFLEKLRLKPNNAVEVMRYQDDVILHHTVSSADVVLLFSSLNNPWLKQLLKEEPEFRIYNFNASGYTYGSVIDGFCLQFPQAIPFTVPEGTFDNLPETPVQTFAVYDVLICHKRLETELVYDALESIFHSRARLAQDNFEFGLLNENFDSHTFLFPLHEGTTAYLNRNQPTFWERYAELIGLVVSILAIATGAISTSYHNMKQRKKDKIDEYYAQVIELSGNAHRKHISPYELNTMLNELLQIRSHVFQLLVEERISANNAFIVFLLLTQSTLQHLESRLDRVELFTEEEVSSGRI